MPALLGAVSWWLLTGQLAGAGVVGLVVAGAGVLFIFFWKLIQVPAQMYREAQPPASVNSPARIAPAKPQLVLQSQSGRVQFDYSTNNGVVLVGSSQAAFPLKFSKASDQAIHFYRNGSAIVGVARVKNPEPKSRLAFGDQDSSSRTYMLWVNDVGLAVNSAGYFLQLRIHGISDDSRGAVTNSVDFSFSINGDGSSDFEALDR